MTISLREITDNNADSVHPLRTTPDQERFVSSVVHSLAEAAEVPQANPWFRAVYADERPVGFVMLAWDVDPQPPGIIGPWFLWKLLIDHRHQRLGYGREVVRQIVEVVRGQGAAELLTSYEPGDGGPAGFYELVAASTSRRGTSTTPARSSRACRWVDRRTRGSPKSAC